MKNNALIQKLPHFLLSAVFLAAAYLVNVSNEKPPMFISKQDKSINFDSSLFTYVNLGLKRLISSTLWVATILESDIEHYKKKDLNSWMFLRFNSIAELEPKFYENYSFGGIYLSIIKDDIEGASVLYQRGILIYPNDYSLLKHAAFHFYFEAKDLETSYTLFKRLKEFPDDSSFTKSTLSRLEAKRGNLDEAFFILSEYQKKYPKDSIIGKKIYEYRYSLKAELDLSCLNNNFNDCSKYDLDHNPYQKIHNYFRAAKAWEPYRPKWKK